MPVRIQRKRTKGWRMPGGAINVTRPGPWGNPFIVSKCSAADCRAGAGHWHCFDMDAQLLGREQILVPFETKIDAAHMAVALFRDKKLTPHRQDRARSDLRGRDLACWCPLSSACHADVLAELADSVEFDGLLPVPDPR